MNQYKRVSLTIQIIDNGQGAGYLRLVFPDGTYEKVFPLGDTEDLYDLMQEWLDKLPNEYHPTQEAIDGGWAG